MGRVETIGRATLYLGDCREILPTLQGVDAIVSDPPYGIGHRRGTGASREGGRHSGSVKSLGFTGMAGDDKPFDAAHLMNWPCVLWGANYYAHTLPPAQGSWLIWDKVEHGGAGDFSDAEIGWCSRKGATKTFHHMWMGVQRASEQAQPRLHPTQKPIALLAWSIGRLALNSSAVICDPYMGSGTTGIAAAQSGHDFIGIELDPVHFETACRRIEDAQRQGSLFDTEAA